MVLLLTVGFIWRRAAPHPLADSPVASGIVESGSIRVYLASRFRLQRGAFAICGQDLAEFGFGDHSFNNFQAIDYDRLEAVLIAQH